jgi:hypothetical protein
VEHRHLLGAVAVLRLDVHIGDLHPPAPDRERPVVSHGGLVLENDGMAAGGDRVEQSGVGHEEEVVRVAARPEAHSCGVGCE